MATQSSQQRLYASRVVRYIEQKLPMTLKSAGRQRIERLSAVGI
jgi:hypothetical protein